MARLKRPTLKEKLASVLISQLGLPSHEAIRLSAADVLRRFECHHVLPRGMGGDNRPYNLHMMLTPAHRERTPGDISAVAKHKRGIDKRAGRGRRKGPAMPGSKSSRFKKHLDGSVSLR